MSDLRKIAKALEGTDQRRSGMMLAGVVTAVQGAKVKVKLTDQGEDGAIITPWLRIPANTGKRGGGVSRFIRYGVGEAVLVVSPSGTPGPGSAVMPWVDTDDDPSPGAAEQDGEVIAIGDTRVEIKGNSVKIARGAAVFEMRADGTILLDAPVLMPKGFTAGTGAAGEAPSTIQSPLTVEKTIRSNTRVSAPVIIEE
jgi:hypothetical protein